ncbi:MAG: selenoprotein B glycine/betaine/sarcosine/D-proline reductase [Chloroflexi bacterium]|nr:selenoprotein B glycine/betaine/sarcosine/D-proline reductase [Chloroflexota bacterium]MYD74849.1 selenoprotein B glycine/betaine/sarcosine/D-proline reductase [Chloroflexota bacterium]
MVRLSDLHPEEAEHMLQRAEQLRRRNFDHEATPWLTPRPLSESTIALVTTAALHRRDDPPFRFADSGYRLIPDDIDPNDLVQSHISVNFDRTHYQRDINVVLPLDRMHELADAGEIGGVSPTHYSILGATEAFLLEPSAAEMARRMHDEGVDAALLVPV